MDREIDFRITKDYPLTKSLCDVISALQEAGLPVPEVRNLDRRRDGKPVAKSIIFSSPTGKLQLINKYAPEQVPAHNHPSWWHLPDERSPEKMSSDNTNFVSEREQEKLFKIMPALRIAIEVLTEEGGLVVQEVRAAYEYGSYPAFISVVLADKEKGTPVLVIGQGTRSGNYEDYIWNDRSWQSGYELSEIKEQAIIDTIKPTDQAGEAGQEQVPDEQDPESARLIKASDYKSLALSVQTAIYALSEVNQAGEAGQKPIVSFVKQGNEVLLVMPGKEPVTQGNSQDVKIKLYKYWERAVIRVDLHNGEGHDTCSWYVVGGRGAVFAVINPVHENGKHTPDNKPVLTLDKEDFFLDRLDPNQTYFSFKDAADVLADARSLAPELYDWRDHHPKKVFQAVAINFIRSDSVQKKVEYSNNSCLSRGKEEEG